MTEPRHDYTVPVAVETLPKEGRRHDIRPTAADRAAIAERLALDGLDALNGEISVIPAPGREYAVEGTLRAEVRQTCVVTGEPLTNVLEIPVQRRFSAAPVDDEEADEDDLDDTDLELPEPIEDGVIDVGAIAVEELSLALDPYPRTPGLPYVSVAAAPPGRPTDDPSAPPASPFAKLADLKKKMESDG